MNTQYRKNLKAVAQACKDYTDEKIKKVYYDIGHNDITTDDHINEPTYHFTAPANAKLLMLQSIAGNSNKIAPSTPSDDSVARIKTIPDNTYKSQVDYIGGKSVKYNQLVSVQSGTKNITAPYGIIYSFVTVDFTHKYFLNAKHSVSFDNLNINFYVAGSGNVRNQQLVGSTSIQAILNPNYNAIGNINCYCANSTDITVSYDSLELIDLTDIFGAGNEPSTVETAIPLLKANGYKLDGTDTYSTGSLKHAVVSGVKYWGINLFDINATHNTINGTTTINGNTITVNATYYCAFDIYLPLGTYTLSYEVITSNPNVGIKLYYSDGTISNLISSGNSITIDKVVEKILLYSSFGTTATAVYSNVMLVKGTTTPSTYIPYVAPITKAIPSQVLADNRYGLGFDNTNYNHLDIDGHLRGKYNTRTYTSSNVIEYTTSFTNVKYFIIRKPDDYIGYGSTVTSFKSSKFEVSTASGDWDSANNIGKILATFDYTYFSIGFPVGTTLSQAQTAIDGLIIDYEMSNTFDQDYSQYFDTNWNKVDLDNLYATCEMVVAEPIDMPNKVEYYGTIIHSLATAVKQDGFNVWDEEYLNGYLNSQGQYVAFANSICSKNYNEILPSTTYYCKSATYNATVYFYDSNYNYISFAYLVQNNTFTTPSNAKYFKLGNSYNEGGTYNHDICINISNQDLNGTYKPHKPTITRLLPNSEAKYSWGITNGVRNIRVFCDDEGNAVNEGSLVVGNNDLGELNDWEIRSGETNLFQSGALRNVIKKTTDNDQVANALCDIYSIDTTNNVLAHTSNTIAVFPSGYIGVYDSLFTNATIFKTAMNGVPLFYQKNTTDTETLDDFDYFFDCEEGDTFTIIGCELLQCYATYSFLIKEAKSNE